MLKSQNFLGRLDDAFSNRDPRSSGVKTPPLPESVTTPAKSVSGSPSPSTNEPLPTPEPSTTTTPTAKSESATGNRLIVGPDVKLKGAEILDCDTLVVEGRVEATMDSHIIRIAEQGTFCGKVCIDTAEIHGQFDGELTARGQLIIHSTGRVSGKIRYGKILIEEGGQISGDIQPIATAENVSDAHSHPQVAKMSASPVGRI